MASWLYRLDLGAIPIGILIRKLDPPRYAQRVPSCRTSVVNFSHGTQRAFDTDPLGGIKSGALVKKAQGIGRYYGELILTMTNP